MNDQHTIHDNYKEIKPKIDSIRILRGAVTTLCVGLAMVTGYWLGASGGDAQDQHRWYPALSGVQTAGNLAPEPEKSDSRAISTRSGTRSIRPADLRETYDSQQFFAGSTDIPASGSGSNPVSGTVPVATSSSGQFFASKSGKTYYPKGCKAGNRVKVENRIYFDTAAEAEFEGLKRAVRC